MGSRLGRRVVHFMNLPIKLLMPSPPLHSIREIALKTLPSASKIEIRRVLESLYGFEVDEVRTLNMEGKKRKRGRYLAAKPDYKKAYVTLRSPLSLDPALFPIRVVQEERERVEKASKVGVVEQGDGGRRNHWLDDDDDRRRDSRVRVRIFPSKSSRDGRGGRKPLRGKEEAEEKQPSRFPWSSMRLWG